MNTKYKNPANVGMSVLMLSALQMYMSDVHVIKLLLIVTKMLTRDCSGTIKPTAVVGEKRESFVPVLQ